MSEQLFDAAKVGMAELDETLADAERLLKDPSVGAMLADRGVNISLALVALSGLTAYVTGNRDDALEDFSTVAEELATRARVSG